MYVCMCFIWVALSFSFLSFSFSIYMHAISFSFLIFHFHNFLPPAFPLPLQTSLTCSSLSSFSNRHSSIFPNRHTTGSSLPYTLETFPQHSMHGRRAFSSSFLPSFPSFLFLFDLFIHYIIISIIMG